MAWIDVDVWLRYVTLDGKIGGYGFTWEKGRLLNFSEAEALAKASG